MGTSLSSEKAKARKRVLELQRRIYLSLQKEAKNLLGQLPHAIRKYESEFQRDFRLKRIEISSKEALVSDIRHAEVTLVSDFHTFPQAQRTALRLLRDAYRPSENWMIGLEMVPSRFQPALDEFQRGRLSLEDFHRLIQYREEWGFPWQNYAPLFEWARKNGIHLLALNLPKEFSTIRDLSTGDLHQRDRWAAGLIVDQLFLQSDLRLIVLYGDLHLSSSHLPAQIERVGRLFLKRKPKTVVVHQNHDELYWRLAKQGREMEANVVKMRAGQYCVFSSTPWHKLQTVVNWAEGEHAGVPGSTPEDPDDHWDDAGETDYVSILETYGRILAELLEIPLPSFENLIVRTIDQAEFLEGLLENQAYPASERKLIRAQITRNRRVYIPHAHVAYLGSPTANGAAELSAAHIMHSVTRSHELRIKNENDFCRWMMESAFAFFGSLVINPRRKCDLPADHVRAIKALKKDRTLKQDERRDEIRTRQITLAVVGAERSVLKNRELKIPELTREFKGTGSAQILLEAARFCGRILGKRVHQALLEGALGHDMIRMRFLMPSAATWQARYAGALDAVAPAKVRRSKQETL